MTAIAMRLLRTFPLILLFGGLIQAAPVKLIFDTDMGNDVDDAMALAMIHSLQKRGAVELLAVTITKDHPKAAAFVDAMNTFYGRPDVPIGVVRQGATPEPGKFNQVADATNPDGSLRYPHDLRSGEQAPEAVGLIRKILAAQPDASVALVQVGFFTNFARLLDSKPDAHSPLAGRELIAKKVKVFSIMAGAFQTVNWNTRHLEYNVIKDIPAAQGLAKRWPTPVIWSGFEIGVAAAYPHVSIERDFEYVKHHPLKESYYAYNPPPHDRPTWDPTALLYAVYPDRGYFDLSPPGTVTVEDNGATWFRPGRDGKGQHRYLVMSPAQAARVREAIVQLCVEPPAKLPR
ncbi:MAG: nucleoside hydrolase [Verrucomicrobia bacterium]|nr:nucleoside hydrolase [Verrucomicrobiota bacterium]